MSRTREGTYIVTTKSTFKRFLFLKDLPDYVKKGSHFKFESCVGIHHDAMRMHTPDSYFYRKI